MGGGRGEVHPGRQGHVCGDDHQDRGSIGHDRTAEKRSPSRKCMRQSPTLGAKPPQGAVVLFDGKDARTSKAARSTATACSMSAARSKQKFGDCTLHIEFRTAVHARSPRPGPRQQRRLSAGPLRSAVLDSFGLKGENNECGGLYTTARPGGEHVPAAAGLADVRHRLSPRSLTRREEDGKNARVTVKHNGVMIHNDFELPGERPRPAARRRPAEPGPIQLQDHGNPVRYPEYLGRGEEVIR